MNNLPVIEYDKMDRLVDAIGEWVDKFDPKLQPGQILGLVSELLFLCEKETKE